MLPGGKAVLFTAISGLGWDESQVEVLQLDTKERRVMVRGGHTGRFLAPAHLVYYRAGTLSAVPFDLARLQVTSVAPVTIAEGVLQSGGTVGAAYAVSSNERTLAYVPVASSSRQLAAAIALLLRAFGRGSNKKSARIPVPVPSFARLDRERASDGKPASSQQNRRRMST